MAKFESIVIRKKESKESRILGIIALIGLVGFMILRLVELISKNENTFGLLYLLFILCFMIGFLGMIVLGISKKKKDFEKIGSLTVEENILKVVNDSFEINNLNNLRFDYGGINGEAINARGAISDGSDNILHFKFNGKNFHVHFLLDSESQRDNYIKMLESLYENRINFVENHFRHGRTYLMKKLSFSEIQEFKNKYKP